MNRFKIGFFLLIASLLITNYSSAQTAADVDQLKQLGLTDTQIKELQQKYLARQSSNSSTNNINATGSDTTKAPIFKSKNSKSDSLSIFKNKKNSKKSDGISSDKEDADSNAVVKDRKYPGEVIFGQNLFRTNSLKVYDKASEILAPENYVIGVGDELSVSIWGFSDYNERFTVNELGYISPKYIGRVYLKGLTLKDAKEVIRKKLGQISDASNSQSDIALTYSRVITVNIVGEVFTPGSYTMPAINTAFNALVAAGGPSQIGSVRNIFIKRGGKIIDSLDVYRFLMDATYDHDVFLQNNDYILVSPAKKVVKISGDVKRPNSYELKTAENLNALIGYSGGINKTAFTSNAHLYRYDKNKQIIIDINIDSLQNTKTDFALFDADSLDLGKIQRGLEQKVSITGAIRVPGDYEIKKGDKISDLLTRAQGLSIDAYLTRGYVLRIKTDLSRMFIPVNIADIVNNINSTDNLELQNRDIIKILSKKDFTDSLRIAVVGAVRKPGEYDYSLGVNLKDALLQAGGLRPGAANNKIEIARIISYNAGDKQLLPIRAIVNTMSVNNDLTISIEAENFKLEPYDQIFVRTNPDFILPKNILLKGEVRYPGSYALLRKNETVSEVIERAGGLTQYAFLDGVTMTRAKDSIGFVYLNLDKALKKHHSKFDYVLFNGDSITIPVVTNTIQITGAIGNIKERNISSPYFGGRASFYIRNFAGRFGSDSFKRRTYVTYPNGIIRRTHGFGIINIYPRVKQGSIITVPYKVAKIKQEKIPFDWNNFIEKTTIKITGILTVFVLARALKAF
jgi:polysaccharide export outer membrane protein